PVPPASTGRKASKAATPQKASAVSKSTKGAPGGNGRAWAATEKELAVLERLGKEGVWQVGGRELKLTNLEKILFPPTPDTDEEPITKRELIAYFGRIGPVLLPHLADRPLNLHRFPNGAGGPAFWQKDLPPHTPDWLRKWKESEAWLGGLHRD